MFDSVDYLVLTFSTNYMEETENFLLLNHIPGLGPVKVNKLLSIHGSAKEILKHFTPLDSWKEDLALVKKEKIDLISIHDPRYPKMLKELRDPPFLLYVKGALPSEQTVGIVGTRHATLYGQEMAERFGREVASRGFTVISGLARGIDTCAHKGALQTGLTLAVLGSGLANIYPSENKTLASQISLISEFPMQTPPDKFNFPKRNRIVNGLSKGMLLIEAPLKSGAMITMEMAVNSKKKCYALSGRIDSPTFAGNHFLIKEQKARLVENPQEMLSLLYSGIDMTSKNGENSLNSNFVFTENEKRIMHLLSQETSVEELAVRTEFPMAKLNSLLMGLVLKKKVREFPGKQYKRIF